MRRDRQDRFEDPPDARFVFHYAVHGMDDDSFVAVVDVTYRARLPGIIERGTLTADEIDGFVRGLEAHDVWALDDAADGTGSGASCQPWTTIHVRVAARSHHVRYYGTPNVRVQKFEEFLNGSIVMRRAHRLEPGETVDPTLTCVGCWSRYATGSTTCRHDGNGLVRKSETHDNYCASCGAELPVLIHGIGACPTCRVPMVARE